MTSKISGDKKDFQRYDWLVRLLNQSISSILEDRKSQEAEGSTGRNAVAISERQTTKKNKNFNN